MIKGIGTDIIEIERIKKACEKEAFLLRVFTKNEIEYSNNPQKFAGTFAAKEAISKCFGTGIAFDLKDIEILRDEKGKPFVKLYGKALEISKDLGIKKVFITITDEDNLAVAMAVCEG